MNAVTRAEPLAAALERLVGAPHVHAGERERRFYSHDIARPGALAALAVAPGTVEELAGVVAASTAAGLAVYPRGGGTSYTGGFLPENEASVVIDTRRLDRVVDVNVRDMHVTVESGVTWNALRLALQPHGVRTPFWGPLSGAVATVGGSLSQNAILWGSARHGASAETVIGLDVVLADGSVLRTGAGAARSGTPFFRNFGPDLTGPFLGDCGALGVKARATLKLQKMPAATGAVSFGFDTHVAASGAMADFAREGLATECFGMDPELQRQRLKRAKVSQGLKAIGNLVAGPAGLAKGLKDAAKIAVAGRGFLDDVAYSVHVGTEGRSARMVDATLDELRAIARTHGGRELPNSVPALMRGSPFVPMSSAIGPDGERWMPVHALVPHSDAADAWAAVQALFAGHAAAFEKHGITVGVLTAVIGASTFVLEPVFYWPAPRTPWYETVLDADTLAKFKDFPPNPEGEALAFEVRRQLIDLFSARGAAHLQVGRSYRYRDGVVPATWDALAGLKRAVDPRNLMNPGSLGL